MGLTPRGVPSLVARRVPAAGAPTGGMNHPSVPWEVYDWRGRRFEGAAADRHPVMWTPGMVAYNAPGEGQVLFRPRNYYGRAGSLLRPPRACLFCMAEITTNWWPTIRSVIGTDRLDAANVMVAEIGFSNVQAAGPSVFPTEGPLQMGLPSHGTHTIAAPVSGDPYLVGQPDPDQFRGGQTLVASFRLRTVFTGNSFGSWYLGAVVGTSVSIDEERQTFDAQQFRLCAGRFASLRHLHYFDSRFTEGPTYYQQMIAEAGRADVMPEKVISSGAEATAALANEIIQFFDL